MSVDHATERSYVRSQIEAGRNPAELHKLVDDVVASVLSEAPGKRIKAQSVERQHLDRRALELAKAHHAAMGPAMRDHMPGQRGTVVGDWHAMPKPRRDTMVAVMRKLLDDGVVA